MSAAACAFLVAGTAFFAIGRHWLLAALAGGLAIAAAIDAFR